MAGTYYEDVPDRLIRYMRDVFGSYFKAYFDGDPIQIGRSYLPCMIIENMTSSHKAGASQTDRMDQTVMIKLVLNKADDYGAAPDIEMTKKKLRRLVAGRDATTGQYRSDSVMGALRTQISLGNALIVNDNDVQYEADVRENTDDSSLVTSEAWITVSTREVVNVPIRN